MLHSFVISLIILISGTPADKKVDNFLKEKLSGYDQYDFEIVKAPTDNFEFANEESIKLNGGLNYLPVRIKNQNGGIVQSYLTIRLRLYKKVFVAKKDISQKQNINPQDFELNLIELTNQKGTPITSSTELIRLRSKSLIKSGTVLLRESLENEPVIKNGDWINASSVSGSVLVEVDAEARQEGIEGDIIKIMTKDKKNFKAKIINSQNVIIIE